MPSASSIAEAVEILRSASAGGRHIHIGEDLDAAGMTRILEHEAGDLTCTVESGIRVSELNRALAEQRQRLSLDAPGDPTVGACLAASLSGPLRHRFGAPRDLVLGVTLVLADGTVTSAGGKVVKNVAGYDLGKLVCGSRGRLAFIARVSLRLHPVPAVSRTLVVRGDDAAATVVALQRSHLQPSALDVLHPGRVLALFEGGERAVAAQLATAQALVGGEEADASVWEECRARQGMALGRRRFAPGELGPLLAELDEAVIRPSAGVAYLPRQVEEEASPAVLALQERVRAAFDPRGVLV